MPLQDGFDGRNCGLTQTSADEIAIIHMLPSFDAWGPRLRRAHPQGFAVTAAATMAVEVVLCASHSTEAAEVTVELLLAGVIVKEVALEAGVGPKLDTAARTMGGHRLP